MKRIITSAFLFVVIFFCSCTALQQKTTYSGLVKGKYLDPYFGPSVYFYDCREGRNITVQVTPNLYNNLSLNDSVSYDLPKSAVR